MLEWVLDLYFSLPTAAAKHEILRLAIGLPVDAARPRLVAELRSDNSLNRQAAAKALGNMSYPDRRELLEPLLKDPDRFVRASVKALTRG